MDKPPDVPDTVELHYIDAAGVKSAVVTGVVGSRVVGGLHQLTFYTDVNNLEPELLTLAGPENGGFVYKTDGKGPTATPIREVQAKLLLTPETVRSLLELLKKATESGDGPK